MGETISDVGEFGLIHRLDAILRAQGAASSDVSIGIGDDTAAFRPRPGREVLVTCDSMVEGRHYLPDRISPFDLGRRAMAINISDVGAMGGEPRYALVSLGLRASTPVADVEGLYLGFLAELNPLGASIIGGNLTKTDGAPFIDVTLIGEAESGRILRRATARPGDAILVTGFPGQAAAGLRLLLGDGGGPEPGDEPLVRAYTCPAHRAREGRGIAQAGCATAMIDTSDGFLGDLGHICEESGVGAELVQERLPVSEVLRRAAARLGADPYALVLGESDDYELIITSAPDRVADVRSAVEAVSPLPVTVAGRITETAGEISLVGPDGRRSRLPLRGWDHFAR
ncbi:MAG: thiamine-phosphate kinase [Deltaproteobacteria bacterium]|nr:thiamine-phosphate kinase [Deltaproteobacteria bacterium]